MELWLILNGFLLLTLCHFAVIITVTQYCILYTLYINDDILTYYIHISISLIPSLLMYIYLLYGIIFWGDPINPLLPFIIIWKSYINEKSKIDETSVYQCCTMNNLKFSRLSYICCTTSHSIITYIIVLPIVSILSQLLVIIGSLIHAISAMMKQPKSYDILVLQVIHMVPNFFMYSVMLFTTTKDITSQYYNYDLITLIIIYWISSMIYVCLYVIFCSSKDQPSDLIMLTELLLLFACLYIALLIDYNNNDFIHSISIIILLLSAITDGCFLKAVPIRDYIQYSMDTKLYQFQGNKNEINSERLYCLIHHLIYHYNEDDNDNKKENEGYLNVEIKELHEIDSIECYELKNEFMQMNENDKKQHIDKLLINQLYIKNDEWDKKLEERLLNIYWLFSIIVALFPMIWIFYVFFVLNPSIININDYLDIFVLSVICLYGIMLTITLWNFYLDYDKYQIMSKLKQIDNLSLDEIDSLNQRYDKMMIATEILNFIEIDAIIVILLFLYGDNTNNKKLKQGNNQQFEQEAHYEMDHLL